MPLIFERKQHHWKQNQETKNGFSMFFLSPNWDTTPFACQRSFWHVDETYPGTKIPETYLLGNARQIGGPVGGANAATHQNRKDLSGDDVRQQEDMKNQW